MGLAMTERKSRGGKPPEEPRRRGQRAVSDLLPEIGGAAFKRFGFVQSAIVSRWAEIVGARYAEVSAPESIRFPTGKKSDGTLTLTVTGAHAPMMQHVAPAIMERVNRATGTPGTTLAARGAGRTWRLAPQHRRSRTACLSVGIGRRADRFERAAAGGPAP
jgi:hypothetical protein